MDIIEWRLDRYVGRPIGKLIYEKYEVVLFAYIRALIFMFEWKWRRKITPVCVLHIYIVNTKITT